jgi:hypothetical protein
MDGDVECGLALQCEEAVPGPRGSVVAISRRTTRSYRGQEAEGLGGGHFVFAIGREMQRGQSRAGQCGQAGRLAVGVAEDQRSFCGALVRCLSVACPLAGIVLWRRRALSGSAGNRRPECTERWATKELDSRSSNLFWGRWGEGEQERKKNWGKRGTGRNRTRKEPGTGGSEGTRERDVPSSESASGSRCLRAVGLPCKRELGGNPQ